jgi:hypothetical protein
MFVQSTLLLPNKTHSLPEPVAQGTNFHAVRVSTVPGVLLPVPIRAAWRLEGFVSLSRIVHEHGTPMDGHKDGWPAAVVFVVIVGNAIDAPFDVGGKPAFE